MAKTTRNVVMAMATVGMLVVGRTAAADDLAPAVETPAALAHVRSESPSLREVIRKATERSATFRQMIETIEASDSYVYVNEGHCGHGVRACFFSVTTAGDRRMLWVKVDPRKEDWDLMGSIGHELRHTIEVIGSPTVRSNQAMFFFYEQNGTHGITGAHETQAATYAGNAVRSEVRKFTRQAKSE